MFVTGGISQRLKFRTLGNVKGGTTMGDKLYNVTIATMRMQCSHLCAHVHNMHVFVIQTVSVDMYPKTVYICHIIY